MEEGMFGIVRQTYQKDEGVVSIAGCRSLAKTLRERAYGSGLGLFFCNCECGFLKRNFELRIASCGIFFFDCAQPCYR
ncbi:unnamed protein product [Meloidogyne enterolobii]|uniref:Uncharacterized protein n=1 Tax=Meloidogyne enterolobii TaxID=390850 RepID=A0ACB0XSF8_MELEN